MDMNCYNCGGYNECLRNALSKKPANGCANNSRIDEGIKVATQRLKEISGNMVKSKDLNEILYGFLCNRSQK